MATKRKPSWTETSGNINYYTPTTVIYVDRKEAEVSWIFQALRTSEFWVGIAAVIGGSLVQFGVVSAESWNNVLYPAIVYIVGRVISKIVKGAPGA